ncbi:hypothetical protein [Sinorhizobium americanum]|uniref:hypothetical protein n=1 Tax=Sinorhizobium americanum TaxID=194963 RepID=UPI00056748BC|nr:hypothetical protein [Sinorhizobium americanum]OAP44030.1 hypothetical protein ATC00_28315 [Sinorhizobium americanum]
MPHADGGLTPGKPDTLELPEQSSPAADFRIQRKEAQKWRISLLSPRAIRWFETNFVGSTQEGHVFEAGLAEANAFIQKARMDGFKVEYVGPLARSYF